MKYLSLFIIIAIVFCSTYTVDAATDIVNDPTLSTNLEACYDLDEESGTRFDSSGNSRDLTDNNTVLFNSTAVIGNAADLEASNSESLSTTSDMGLGSGFTFSTWGAIEQAPASGQADEILAYYFDGAGSADYGMRMLYENSGGTLRLRFYRQGSTNTFLDKNVTLTLDQYNHFAFTWDGSLLRAYHNGVEYASSSNSGTVNLGSATGLALGKNGVAGGGNYDGEKDITAVWSSALSASSISDLYNSGAGIACEAVAEEAATTAKTSISGGVILKGGLILK